MINEMDEATAQEKLFSCCSSHQWVSGMLEKRPFTDSQNLLDSADDIWFGLDHSDWLEAFEGHPKIGDVTSLRKKYRSTKETASNEQSGV